MKDYMLIFRGGEPPADGSVSPEEMQYHFTKWKTWIDTIAAKDKYVAGHPLLPHGKVMAGKNVKTTDGPFLEGKEAVGGYCLIRADDYEEAVALSQDCPGFEFDGSVEIREVLQM